MTAKDLLLDQIEYQHHYNQKIISHVASHLDQVTEATLEWLNHSVAAQVIWNQRIEGLTEFDSNLWTNRDIKLIQQWENDHYMRSKRILENNPLEKIIHFKNSKGDTLENTVQEILTHAMNHYSYHRGQITWELRKAGLDAIPSDYILFKR